MYCAWSNCESVRERFNHDFKRSFHVHIFREEEMKKKIVSLRVCLLEHFLLSLSLIFCPVYLVAKKVGG